MIFTAISLNLNSLKRVALKYKTKRNMSTLSRRKQEMKPKSWESLPWTKVNVKLSKETDDLEREPEEEGLTDDEFLNSSNHYDDPLADPNDLYTPNDSKIQNYRPEKKGKCSKKQLQDTDRDMEGADDPGILLGLEVIDGSQYRIEKIPNNVGGYVSRLVWSNFNDDNSNKDAATKTTRTPHPAHNKQQNGKHSLEDRVKAEKSGKTKKRAKLSGSDNDDDHHNMKMGIPGLKLERDDYLKVDNKDLPSKPTKTFTHVKDDIKSFKDKSDATKLDQVIDANPTQDKIDETQTSWAATSGGVYLHNHICCSLAKLGFSYPTPIQASTLSASILGKRDIAGAAPTGSGKTLAYLIPILQFFLEERDLLNTNEMDKRNNNQRFWPLTALILCPTRELALQVSQEFEKLSRRAVSCGNLVGGLSEEKQKRILDVKRPPILVATPGRLWSLMSSKDHTHLNDLSKLRFLVIDEVDRMISKGSYPQLVEIFDAINKANPVPLDGDSMVATSPRKESDDDDRLQSLEGVPGEAKVIMLSDEILKRIESQKQGFEHNVDDGEASDSESDSISLKLKALPDPYFPEEDQSDTSDGFDETIHRQTFVFSATLSLPPSTYVMTKHKKVDLNTRKKGTVIPMAVQSLHDILKTAGARGQLKFVDLSNDLVPSNEKSTVPNKSDPTSTKQTSSIQLPPGLSLYEILCTKKHKDSHLYAFLTTTEQGSTGPCLIFCNSIAAVKRVGQTLRVLGLPVRTLHGHMEQKARLSSIDSLKRKESRLIVVATDVAARGIDLPSIAAVIHYDVARSLNTFIHRSGRTARGIGCAAVGISVSLVDPSEEKDHKKICETLQGQGRRHFQQSLLDGQLLTSAQTRVALATVIVDCELSQSKSTKSNSWLRQAAAEADLDIDEDLLDNGLENGSLRDQHRLKDATKAKVELKKLLASPMKKQHFGKFLSGTGLRKSINSMVMVKPYVIQNDKSASRKRRKR